MASRYEENQKKEREFQKELMNTRDGARKVQHRRAVLDKRERQKRQHAANRGGKGQGFW